MPAPADSHAFEPEASKPDPVPPRPAKLHALTSLRFVGAAMVVLYHSQGRFGLPAHLEPLSLGVSFFFVLSGFILTYVYPDLDAAGRRRFLAARFARIWPGHLAGLALAAALATPLMYQPGGRLNPARLAANALMVQTWLPIGGAFVSYNPPSWSIATEVAFYLCFPWLIRAWRTTWRWKLAGALALALAMIVLAGALQLPVAKAGVPGFVTADDIVLRHPAARLFEFVLGMTAALAYRAVAARLTTRRHAALGTLIEAAALALAAGAVLSMNPIDAASGEAGLGWAGAVWVSGCAVPGLAFALLIVVLALERGWLSRFLRWRVAVLLGEISYAVYLVHFSLLLRYFGKERAFAAWPAWATYAMFWAILLLTSHLVWLLVERPCRRTLLRWFDRRGARPAEDGPAGPLPVAESGAAAGSPATRPRGASPWPLAIAEATVLAALCGVAVWRLNYRPAVEFIPSAQADAAAAAALPDSRDTRFGSALVLRGLSRRLDPGGHTLWLDLTWQAREEQHLDTTVAIHLVDAEGNFLRSADYLQDPAHSFIPAGAQWRETVAVPVEPLDPRLSGLALGVFERSDELLEVSRGPRDWGGRRLRLSLPPVIRRLEPDAVAEFVERSVPDSRGVQFGSITLVGAALARTPAGLHVELVWHTPDAQPLADSVAVHLLDAEGHVLGQKDFPQDPMREVVPAGLVWHDTLFVPKDEVGAAVGLGLGVFDERINLYPVDRGPRDMDDRRLVLPLPGSQ